MYDNKVWCGSSAYNKKFYFNEEFDKLPDSIKEELNIMCVLFTEEVGGILTLEFAEDGTLEFKVQCDEDDILFDDISCGLKMKQMQKEKKEIFEALEMFYKVFYLNEEIPE